MLIKKSCLKNIRIPDGFEVIHAELFFPKIVVIGTKSISIFDLNNEDTLDKELSHYFDDRIIHYIAYNDMLWLAFKCGNIALINPIKNSMLRLQYSGYANYIIYQFLQHDENLYLITESGDFLSISIKPEDFVTNLRAGNSEGSITYDKVHLPRIPKGVMKVLSNGVFIQVNSGNIVMKCPTTGLFETLSTNVEIQNISLWDKMVVLGSHKKMWLIDTKTYEILLTFDENDKQFLPLAAQKHVFYYLNCSENEIQICCAAVTQNDKELEANVSGHQQKSSSQDSLIIKLKSLVSEIISSEKSLPEIIPQLNMYFNEIVDFTFLINTAKQLCNHNISYKTVLYTFQNRLFESNDIANIDLFSDTMIKIDLLEYIYFRGNTYENFNIFENNFIELCAMFISKSDMDLASICWLKYSEIRPILNSDDINNILNAIPHNIKMSALIIWFRNFSPNVLEQNPFYIDIFVKWTTERVFLLEQSSYWPKIGLTFIISIVDILERSMKSINVRPISMDDLDSLKSHIHYISELKEKYKINMLLSEFSSLSPTEVVLIMLRRCYTEDLEAFLQGNLTCYATRHLFEIDDALRSYIDSETASSGGNVDGHRFRILLNAFQSPSNKLDCLLHVLKVLEVPWDTSVLQIATEAALLVNSDFTMSDSDKILAQEIYKELNYAKIKVILKKYNIPLTCTDYTLIIHKLVNASEVNLEDLKVVAYIMTPYTHYANTLYIDRCLQDCETKMSLAYFKNLSSRNKKVLIKTIENKYEQMITGVSCNPLVERNYLDFLKASELLHKNQLRYLENLYHLKNSYKIKIDLNNLCSEKSCLDEVTLWKEKDGNISSSSRGRCITQLVAEDFSQKSKLTLLLKRASTSQEIRKLIEHLIFSDSQYKKHKPILSLYKDGGNSTLLLDTYDILSELISNCNEENLHYLLQYASMLNAIINAHFILKNLSVAWKFHYIFLPMTSINTLNELINFYMDCSTKKISELDWNKILNTSDFVPFRIMAHVTLSESLDLSHIIKTKEKFTKKIIMKLLASQEVDSILLTALLLTLQNTDIIEDKMWMFELLRGQSDTFSPAVINYLSCPIIRKTFCMEDIMPGSGMSYPPQYILKHKFNINLDEITLPECNEETWDVKVLLFYILRNFANIAFETLIDLCHTLNVSESDGFSLLIISLLTNWELKYKMTANDIGLREILLENHETELKLKCDVIWQNMENKDFLRDILNDLWKNGEVLINGCHVSINPYYYEVYLCIYQLLFSSSTETRNIKEYYLLHFLKQYKRRSPPKQYEYELFSVKGMFPEIGHYRLPFQLFMRDDMWSNLKSEITLETYESWLPVVSLLSLDADLQTAKDMICSNAVKQTMTSRKKDSSDADSKDSEPWRLTTREEPLLKTAHRCVRHIANMEWAGACLFYVLQGCARGADQVAAAQLCYQFSQRWASLQPGNRAVRQMERLHSTLSTRHALHKIDWACDDFLRLITEPAQLIHALYSHPSFIEKISKHDINRVANDIADKNGININTIRIQILENILNKSHKDNKFLPGIDMKDLITAKYILKATCPKMGAIYLSRIAFDDESEYNKCKKLRALQCLMSIIEPENAVRVTNRERSVLWTSLLDLLYIVHIERIDMPWVIATYAQNKQHAVSQLLQNSSGNVDCLKIAAQIAHKYGDMQIIREVIALLLRYGIYEEMIPLLLKILYPPDKTIYTAWRSVILTPFQRADYPITERQKSKCLIALNLLPICPVIKDEDLIEIWKTCVRCKCLGLGCLILPYMTLQARQSLVELQKIDKRNLIISLKNLHTESYLVSGAMFVLENLTNKIYR